MGTTIASFVGFVGIALVMTAVLLPGRQTIGVVNAFGDSTSKIELSSLGI